MITIRDKIINKNQNFNEAVRQASLSLVFIKEAANYFGEGTILVKRDDFVYLIQKYGLVCGQFSDYLGIVPDKNLLEISEAKEKINSISSSRKVLYEAYRYTPGIITQATIKNLRKETSKYLNDFPIILAKENDYAISRAALNYLSDYIPEDELKKIHELKIDLVRNSGMFICAPRKDMKNAEKRITFRAAPKDPFICSLVPYGVVIYSRWGKEAQDEMLTKYDKMFARLKGE